MYAANKSVSKIEATLERLAGASPAGTLDSEQGSQGGIPMFEHFLVVGAPVSNGEFEGHEVDGEAKLLYHYPGDARLKTQDLPLFCFPEGVEAHIEFTKVRSPNPNTNPNWR